MTKFVSTNTKMEYRVADAALEVVLGTVTVVLVTEGTAELLGMLSVTFNAIDGSVAGGCVVGPPEFTEICQN